MIAAGTEIDTGTVTEFACYTMQCDPRHSPTRIVLWMCATHRIVPWSNYEDNGDRLLADDPDALRASCYPVSHDSPAPQGPGLGSFDASTILSCYNWMHLIGRADASSSLDTETLAALFYQVPYTACISR